VFLAVCLPFMVVNVAQGLQFVGLLVLLSLLLSVGTFFISVLLAALMRYGVLLRALLSSTNLRWPVFALVMALVPMVVIAVAGGLWWDAVGGLWRTNPMQLAWFGAVMVPRWLRSASDVVFVPGELRGEVVTAGIAMAGAFAALAWVCVSLARGANALLLSHALSSPWVDALALAVAGLVLLMVVRSAHRPYVAMSSWSDIARLLGAGGQTLSPATQEWLASHVASCHAEVGGYGWCPNAKPDLDATLNALAVLGAAGKGSPVPVLDTQWVLRHQIPAGGFARREAGIPSLAATRAALGCLACLGYELQEEKRVAAARWVGTLQKRDGSFEDAAEGGRHGLAVAADAVACLRRLCGLGFVDTAAALQSVSIAWMKSARTVDETYQAVYACSGLGGLSDDMATAVRQWCLTIVPLLVRLDPRRYAGPLYKAL
jgi:hypothetical protein